MGNTYDRRTVLTTTGAVTAAAAAGLAVTGCEVSRVEAGLPAGTPLGPASAVPVGGGTVFTEHDAVVVQPEEGVFKAYSAKCTHRGCLITTVVEGSILCGCHHSTFALTDGEALSGPAKQPLNQVGVTVVDGVVTTA